MTLKSSWKRIYVAAVALPEGCFDGVFAEGISDTLVRKMGREWKGFLSTLAKHRENKKFMWLVLESVSPSCNPDDLRLVGRLARESCRKELTSQCAAISKQVAVALADP